MRTDLYGNVHTAIPQRPIHVQIWENPKIHPATVSPLKSSILEVRIGESRAGVVLRVFRTNQLFSNTRGRCGYGLCSYGLYSYSPYGNLHADVCVRARGHVYGGRRVSGYLHGNFRGPEET